MANRTLYTYNKKNSKYRAKKTTLDGIQFDSKKEALRWAKLKVLEEAGEIHDLQRQVKFVLIPAQREANTVGARGGTIKGKLIEREVAYYADFVYYIKGSDKPIVEDTKGVRTPEYIIKRKLMLQVHGVRIKEV